MPRGATFVRRIALSPASRGYASWRGDVERRPHWPVNAGERSVLTSRRSRRRVARQRVQRKASEWMRASGRRVASSHGFLGLPCWRACLAYRLFALTHLSAQRATAGREAIRRYGSQQSGPLSSEDATPTITHRLLVALQGRPFARQQALWYTGADSSRLGVCARACQAIWRRSCALTGGAPHLDLRQRDSTATNDRDNRLAMQVELRQRRVVAPARRM
jgi:hypothetical protein